MILKWISENYKKVYVGLLILIILAGLSYLKYQSSKIKSLESDVRVLYVENESNKTKINTLTSKYQKISNAIETFDKKYQSIQDKVIKNNASIKKTMSAIKSDSSTPEENLNKFNALNKSLMQELMSVNNKADNSSGIQE